MERRSRATHFVFIKKIQDRLFTKTAFHQDLCARFINFQEKSCLIYGWIELKIWSCDLEPYVQGTSGRFRDRPPGGRVYLAAEMENWALTELGST